MPLTPEDLFPGVADVESSWRPGAVGPPIPGRSERAIGLTQILPSTAAKYGVSADDLKRPEVQWRVYKQEMGRLLTKYHDDPALALAAWNDGEKNVDNNSIAPSTIEYIKNALRKSPGALEKLRAERGGVMAAAAPTDTIDIGALTSSPQWSKFTPDQQAAILQRAMARNRGATVAPTPSPTPSPTPTARPSAASTIAAATRPTAKPTASPANLGLPGGPGVAFAGKEPVLPPEPSSDFPTTPSPRTIPSEMETLQKQAQQADVPWGPFKFIRQGQTAAVRGLVGAIPGTTPEYAEEAAQDITPQDPVSEAIGGATLAAPYLGPLAEAGLGVPYLGGALEAARIPEIAGALGYGEATGPEGLYTNAAKRVLGLGALGGGVGAASAQPGRRLRGAEEGALQGTTMGLTNEALNFGIGQVGRRVYEPKYLKGTVSDVGDVIGGVLRGSGDPLTSIDVGPLQTAKQFQDEFVGNRPHAMRAADDTLDRFKDYVRQKIGGTPFYMKTGQPPAFLISPQAPPPGYMKQIAPKWYSQQLAKGQPVWMSFDQVESLRDFVQGKAYALSGDVKTSYEAKLARQFDHSVAEEFRKQLNFYEPFLGDKYMEGSRRWGMIKDFNRFFTKAGSDFWAKDPALLPEKLQRAFSGGKLAKSVDQMLGEPVRDQIVNATRHGLDEPRYPVPGTESLPHFNALEPTHTRFRIPHTYKPVGRDLPWYVYPQRGGVRGLIGTQLGRGPARWVTKSVPGFGDKLPELPPDEGDKLPP